MVGGTLYTATSLSQVAAIDAATGETKWMFTPRNESRLGMPAKTAGRIAASPIGAAAMTSGSSTSPLAQMVALDAKTGEPVAGFGKNGRVDLTEGLRRSDHREIHHDAPPMIVRGVIVVGSSVIDWWGKRPTRQATSRLRRPHRQAAVDLPHGGAR